MADDKRLKKAFQKIKEEMDDHLQAINENTNEISASYDYIQELERMISKLSERLDENEMKISRLTGKKTIDAEKFKDIRLTPKEQEIFLLLYEENGDLLDYRKIARRLGLTEEIVIKTVASLCAKGIPIEKKHFDNKIYLVLDAELRNLQAKEKVLKLE
ncbi:MAG: HTH domain-containing protein [Candidatus Woesearchaeota archaeon]|nr:HTH domain-containing protein [Candidatus Woesearchaeota archaeon]